jgi:hypothetical protein
MSDKPTVAPAGLARRGFLSKTASVAAGAVLIGVAIIPAGANADDGVLLKLEEQIFEVHHAAESSNDEIKRLQGIFHAEANRLLGRSDLTERQHRELVDAMPECRECERLINISDAHWSRIFDLVDEMWATPAQTEAGRKAKVAVLLGVLMGREWTLVDEDTDYRVLRGRQLLIEFIGGEPAKQLRDQFV